MSIVDGTQKGMFAFPAGQAAPWVSSAGHQSVDGRGTDKGEDFS